jgi:predicted acylesterase/phospholipase RssA
MYQLCISGGGIRGLSFVGALYELHLKGIKDFNVIAGCSMGAFIGACLIIGYTPEELLNYLFDYDFSSLKDIDVNNFRTNKSIMKGRKVHDFYYKVFAEKLESPNISLQKLFELTKIKFIVAVTCINTQTVEYISHETHPELGLHLLICMTTAIPGILPGISYNGRVYVDGAIVDNLPFYVLDPTGPPIIVITTLSRTEPFIDNHAFNLFTYFSTILRIIYRTPVISESTLLRYKAKLYEIDTGNISVISFNLTHDDKYKLIQSGRRVVSESDSDES